MKNKNVIVWVIVIFTSLFAVGSALYTYFTVDKKKK